VDVVTQKMNEISQRKTELQAQIDALKLEMDTLAT
jgi:outer membrane murein-binding lipoprotein Lpp